MERLLSISKKILIVEVILVGIFFLYFFLGNNRAVPEQIEAILVILEIGTLLALLIIPLVVVAVIVMALAMSFRKGREGFELTRGQAVLLGIPLLSLVLLLLGVIWFLYVPDPRLNCSDNLDNLDTALAILYQRLALRNLAEGMMHGSYILPLIALLLAVFLYFSVRTRSSLLTMLIMLSFLLPFVPFAVSFWTPDVWFVGPLLHSPDSRRISDIQNVRTALVFYEQDRGAYPISAGDTPFTRWQGLDQMLTSPLRYVPALPKDPCFSKNPQWQYDYKSSSDGSNYVLKAILGDPQKGVLDRDVDGEILGIWCGAQGREVEYCLIGS